MKALLSRVSGGSDMLEIANVASPIMSPGDVLVRVRACGLNFPDLLIIEDKYQFRPERPFSPGGEVAGEVVGVGDLVEGLTLGDRVIAFPGVGGMAEMVSVPAQKCIPIPDSMPFDEAAAFITTYGTSYHALKQRGRLQAGENLLVLGAAGGVGLAAVELGAALGAYVIAAASTDEKVALARRHGAAKGFVYPSHVLSDEFKSLNALMKSAVGGPGADLIYDPVGGPYAEAALRAIAWRGRYLVVGFPAGIPALPFNLALLKGCEIVGVFYGAFTEKEPDENKANTRELLQLYVSGKIRPHISARFSLADAAQGFDLMATRQTRGKIVVVND